ncbi:MAG: glycosyltransferase [Pseudomonadota bacterium]
MTARTGDTQITILLGVYGRGAELYLGDQLASISAQDHAAWSLRVSDDSSDEAFRDQVEAFATQVPQHVAYLSGPQAGFAANYIALAQTAPDGWLAFADQDDVWYADKLTRAAAALGNLDGPALYCGRVAFWNGASARQVEKRHTRPPAFRNALIENVARGNTIVLNKAAAALYREAASRVTDVFAHDWLAYLLISGAGGRVIYDGGPPLLDYRQHAENEIGAGSGARAQIARKRAVLKGAFRARMDANLAALTACEDMLTPENRDILHRLRVARTTGLAGLPGLARIGLYRQRPLGTLGFWGASILGRA